MCTDFMIFKHNKFAHRETKSDNYVCYRTVICHALHCKINHVPKDGDPELEATNTFKAFAHAVLNLSEHEDDSFLSLFICKMKNQLGYVIIDKCRGYYPLIAYPYTNKTGAPRSEALKYAVNDIDENLSSIIKELRSHKDWSYDLQKKLQDDFFHYIEDSLS